MHIRVVTPIITEGFTSAADFESIARPDVTEHWEIVRKVAAGSGESFNRNAFDKERRRAEEAAKAKKP